MRLGLWTEYDPVPYPADEGTGQADAWPLNSQLSVLPDACGLLGNSADQKPQLYSPRHCRSQETAVRPVSHSVGCGEADPISDRDKGKSQLTEPERTAEAWDSGTVIRCSVICRNYPEGETREHRTQTRASGITGNNVARD